jgi:hypothetical protein
MDLSSISIDAPENSNSLGHFPGDRWEFDESVARVFDDMLARSIPQIGLMREITDRFGSALIQPYTDVVDLGCACGDSMAVFIAGREKMNRFVGIDRDRCWLKLESNAVVPGRSDGHFYRCPRSQSSNSGTTAGSNNPFAMGRHAYRNAGGVVKLPRPATAVVVCAIHQE